MNRRWLILAVAGMLGCGTTGGRVSTGLAGVATAAVVANQFRLLGCDDGDAECRHSVRTTGFVLGGIAVGALIAAIVLEATGSNE
jgi:hypothetical protein